jgi:hypothetical protein
VSAVQIRTKQNYSLTRAQQTFLGSLGSSNRTVVRIHHAEKSNLFT